MTIQTNSKSDVKLNYTFSTKNARDNTYTIINKTCVVCDMNLIGGDNGGRIIIHFLNGQTLNSLQPVYYGNLGNPLFVYFDKETHKLIVLLENGNTQYLLDNVDYIEVRGNSNSSNLDVGILEVY